MDYDWRKASKSLQKEKGSRELVHSKNLGENQFLKRVKLNDQNQKRLRSSHSMTSTVKILIRSSSDPKRTLYLVGTVTVSHSKSTKLGPLLFLLYINDLCNVSKVMDFILFADDTNIFFSHNDFNSLSETLNTEMSKLTQWCRANKLSINFKKSNFMVFRPRQRRQTLDLSLQIDNNNIDCVKETVFLGVILDEHLSWKPHILSVSRKISKSIGIIYKSSFCLPKTSLHCLYYSLVYPHLLYCVSVWGSTYQSNLRRVFNLQKKMIRIISKVSLDSHTDALFKEHRILKFFDIYFYQIGKFMYLFKKGLLPNYFCNMFTFASQLHSHYTRNCNHYYIPPCRTNIRNFSIRFQGPKFFNSLSPEIQNSESIRSFGNRLKTLLLHKN